MASLEQVMGMPCPTCKMPADSSCVDPETCREVEGIHTSRIHRAEIVTQAIAHNQAIEAQEKPMTEIAIPTAQVAVQAYQQSSIDRLERWAQQAVAVRQMAEGIVNTSFCPKAYRGKPDEATAAILAGAELSLDPMASLRAFDDIHGVPTPKAITLRAVIQSRGHRLDVVEVDDTHAVVEGQRRGEDHVQRLEWRYERALKAGYVATNKKWQTDPQAMLVARATAEMAKWLDSAAIMGMPYSAEEIADEQGLQATRVTRQVTAADIVVQAVESRPAIEQQIQDIRELFHDRGITGVDARLALVNKIVGHDVDALDDLTFDEAEQIINHLVSNGAQA